MNFDLKDGYLQGWQYYSDPSDNPITFDRNVRWVNGTMEHYTPIERAEIVQPYIQKSFSVVKTQRAWRKTKVKSKVRRQRMQVSECTKNFYFPAVWLNKKRWIQFDENIAAVRVRKSSFFSVEHPTSRCIIRLNLGIFRTKYNCLNDSCRSISPVAWNMSIFPSELPFTLRKD